MPTQAACANVPRMRVAVCVAGQLRGYTAAAPSLLERIVKPYGADVFVHTWSDRGTSNNIHNRRLPWPMRSHLKKQGDLDSFRALFPHTYADHFAAEETVTADDLRDVYGPDATVVVEDYPEDEPGFFGTYPPERLLALQPKSKWSLPLFYKIDACNRLKIAKEQADGFTYDVVIRVRPDLSIGSDFLAGRTGTSKVVHHRFHTIDPKYQVGDQLFFGDSDSMNQVTSLFERLPEIYASIPKHLEQPDVVKFWAEGLLFTHITRHTDVTPVPFRTEPYTVKSEYQLLDSGDDGIGFEEFFWSFRQDLLSSTDPGALGGGQGPVPLRLPAAREGARAGARDRGCRRAGEALRRPADARAARLPREGVHAGRAHLPAAGRR